MSAIEHLADASVELFDFVGNALAILWEDWPRDMQVVSVSAKPGDFFFRLKGQCPYANCRHTATFPAVSGGYMEGDRMVAVLQCEACANYVLGIIKLQNTLNGKQWFYNTHYPLDSPDDSVAQEVPAEIASDFKEALRARWVKAYKATMLMCRRALETSCTREKAEGRSLFEQIDDLAKKQFITEPLRNMAHGIRLLGNQGAHQQDYSDITDVNVHEQDADAAIEFMREYLNHVYVLPKKLERYTKKSQ
jgi:hypothetical protein